mgnify:CR=1 FL=1
MKCDSLATTMKWHEISLYMHKPTSSPSRFHFHARKKGSCEHPTEESKDSHDERCFETTVFPHHCGTTAAKVPSSYAHSIARCRTALAPHCSRPGSLACIGNKKGYGSVSRMCGEGKGRMSKARSGAYLSAHVVEGSAHAGSEGRMG